MHIIVPVILTLAMQFAYCVLANKMDGASFRLVVRDGLHYCKQGQSRKPSAQLSTSCYCERLSPPLVDKSICTAVQRLTARQVSF